MDINRMRQNVEQFVRENKKRVTNARSLETLTRDVFSSYPEEVLDDFFGSTDYKEDQDNSYEDIPEKFVTVQLPEKLFSGLPIESISDYLVMLINQSRK